MDLNELGKQECTRGIRDITVMAAVSVPRALASPSALELSLLLLPPFGWQSWAAAGPDIWAASKEESILFHLPLSLTLSSPVFWSVGISCGTGGRCRGRNAEDKTTLPPTLLPHTSGGGQSWESWGPDEPNPHTHTPRRGVVRAGSHGVICGERSRSRRGDRPRFEPGSRGSL